MVFRSKKQSTLDYRMKREFNCSLQHAKGYPDKGLTLNKASRRTGKSNKRTIGKVCECHNKRNDILIFQPIRELFPIVF